MTVMEGYFWSLDQDKGMAIFSLLSKIVCKNGTKFIYKLICAKINSFYALYELKFFNLFILNSNVFKTP